MQKMKQLAHKRRQAGFTLIELGIVVAVAAVLLVLALALVPQVLASNRSNAEIQELPVIISNIQRIYSNQPSYAGITLDAAARLNALPNGRATIPAPGTPATATNRWGGAITLNTANLTTNNDTVQLVYVGVPERECENVVQGVANLTRTISVNSGAANTVVKADNAALDINALGTACGASNTITYSIGK